MFAKAKKLKEELEFGRIHFTFEDFQKSHRYKALLQASDNVEELEERIGDDLFEVLNTSKEENFEDESSSYVKSTNK